MTRYILVVDNNQMNLEFIRYLLVAKGYAVKSAPSVDQGIALMAEAAPCLILSDLNLPGRGGLYFLRKVKETEDWRQIPFVLISASSYLKSDVDRAVQLGADKYLFRPIEPQALMDEIEPFLKACGNS